jgi:flagellar motor switch protein FliN/FliY
VNDRANLAVARACADACANTLSAMATLSLSPTDVRVLPDAASLADTLSYPVVAVRVPLTGETEAETVLLVPVDEMRAIAAGMYGGMDASAALPDSAVTEIVGEMFVAVAVALAQQAEGTTEVGAAATKVLPDGDVAPTLPESPVISHFCLSREDSPDVVHVVQVVPLELGQRLARAAGEIVPVDEPATPALSGDASLLAVERTARISAEAARSVLSMLLGDDAKVTEPTIEAEPDDPLGHITYPIVAIEVAYVSGVSGMNLFALTPPQVASLAALMIGTDVLGDGMSAIELSAASEAMNQMMGAATNILADTLSMDIEISPPSCQVINSLEEARAVFGDWAYISRFGVTADHFSADIVQLVSREFADHMRQAFAVADAAQKLLGEFELPDDAPPLSAHARMAEATFASDGIFTTRMLQGMKVRVSVELGRTRLRVKQVSNLPSGTVVPLDRASDDPLDILVNGEPFAQGKLMLVDGEYAIQVVALTPSPQTVGRAASRAGGS